MGNSQSDEEGRAFGALLSEWMFLAKVPLLATSHLFERHAMCSSTASMEGKTVVVTGATSGIGLETAIELARRKARVILACRDVEKANAVAQLIHDETKQIAVVKRLVLDSFESVREFCDQVNRSEDRLDVLINNAGLINCSTEFTYTKDGFETCFQANHLSPVLLTLMLLEKLRKSAPSRIVNVSSDSHCIGDVSRLEAKARGRCTLRTPLAVYANSKLALCLFGVALADRIGHTGVTVNSLHPGLVQTPIASHGSLLRKLIFQVVAHTKGKTAVEGAQTTVQLAVDPALEKTTGEYFEECAPAGERYRSPLLGDRALAERVFRASVQLVGLDPLEQGGP
ncbi:retinol dehydrogenase 12-like [Dermacentor andersoni]|uniref:retinol dehydrogenase 12-like n=1 Tax=Dermacentor andersoni TaxID=34620 RepID=UPI002155BCED|nr:retinol dehydrogenase 12-like isoform X2 [Dermacentor andersoni]